MLGEHELTPYGYAASVVAGCIMGYYKEDGQRMLDKVMNDPNLRQYVKEKDVEELKAKGFTVAEAGE